MQRKTIVGIAVSLALLLMCGLGWWFVFRKDHQLENVRQLQAEAFGRENRELGDEQRREKFQQYRNAYDKLSERQQRELRRERSRGMQGRMTGHIREYFELPKVQRIAFLDKQNNEMETRRRESTSRARSGERAGGTRGGRAGGGRPERGNNEDRSEADRKERRDRFKRGFLDHTTPQQRAEMAEYMEALRERREQRGLPDFGRRRRVATA